MIPLFNIYVTIFSKEAKCLQKSLWNRGEKVCRHVFLAHSYRCKSNKTTIRFQETSQLLRQDYLKTAVDKWCQVESVSGFINKQHHPWSGFISE